MDSDRRNVALAGVLFICGTVAGITSLGFTDPILSAPDYLASASDGDTRVFFGALLELAMGLSLIGMAIVLYPVLSRSDSRAAIGYFGARLVEFVIYVIGVISLLSLVTLSHEFVAAGAPAASHFQTLGVLLLEARDWAGHVVLDVAVFPLGALLFYSVLFRARLVPRWLSGWGLVGAVLYWAAAPLVMLDLITPFTGAHIALQAPLGIQEIALALWMIIKGFDMTRIAPPTASAQRSADAPLQASD